MFPAPSGRPSQPGTHSPPRPKGTAQAPHALGRVCPVPLAEDERSRQAVKPANLLPLLNLLPLNMNLFMAARDPTQPVLGSPLP